MYICIGDKWAGREGFQVRSGKIVDKTSSLLTQVTLYLVCCYIGLSVGSLLDFESHYSIVDLHAFHISVNNRQSQDLRSPAYALQNSFRPPNRYYDVLLL